MLILVIGILGERGKKGKDAGGGPDDNPIPRSMGQRVPSGGDIAKEAIGHLLLGHLWRLVRSVVA
jgi:hypothetical protein